VLLTLHFLTTVFTEMCGILLLIPEVNP